MYGIEQKFRLIGKSQFRITMAAIDPSAKPEHTGTANGDTPVRATLKMVYDPSGPGEEEDDEEGSHDEDNYLKALLEGRESEDEDEEDDEESSSDDEERNGGPSDPSRTKKARKEAAMKELMDALAEQNESDDEMDVDISAGSNGIKMKSKPDKGKAKALPGDAEEEDGEEESADDSLDGMEELVVCTLDPEKVSLSCKYCVASILKLIVLVRTTNRLLISLFPRISGHTSRFLAHMRST